MTRTSLHSRWRIALIASAFAVMGLACGASQDAAVDPLASTAGADRAGSQTLADGQGNNNGNGVVGDGQGNGNGNGAGWDGDWKKWIDDGADWENIWADGTDWKKWVGDHASGGSVDWRTIDWRTVDYKTIDWSAINWTGNGQGNGMGNNGTGNGNGNGSQTQATATTASVSTWADRLKGKLSQPDILAAVRKVREGQVCSTELKALKGVATPVLRQGDTSPAQLESVQSAIEGLLKCVGQAAKGS